MGKHSKKLNNKKKPQGPDLPLAQAIALLKEEILKEVRALSSGLIISMYKLTELGEELLKLEAEFELTVKAEAAPNKTEEPDELEGANEDPEPIQPDSF